MSTETTDSMTGRTQGWDARTVTAGATPAARRWPSSPVPSLADHARARRDRGALLVELASVDQQARAGAR
jgi:hypothetical protein